MICLAGVMVPSAFDTCGKRYQLGLGAQQLGVFVEQDLTVVIHRSHSQPRACFVRQLLPRHDVRVMLQPGDDDLVVLADELPSPALGNQVDGLRRAAHEDDLFHRRSVQKAAHFLASFLIGVGGARRQFMRGPVNVGVFVLVEILQAVDHRLGLLRGGGVVQPNQLPAVDSFLKNRKILAHQIDVERRSEPAGADGTGEGDRKV